MPAMAQWGAYQQPMYMGTEEMEPVQPGQLHWNEDPHSVPQPLSNKNEYMTSTQAARKLNDKFYRVEDQYVDHQTFYLPKPETENKKQVNLVQASPGHQVVQYTPESMPIWMSLAASQNLWLKDTMHIYFI